ncbi:hypothetical protein [Tranquillimonas alkanivorans]|uniref:Uncharacterized protein n=1 Tax=Tranquillimonas alkanivorans TaxID=441119 RepID=A0A1I5MB47_9RHOB|nr:hypothetical protein [Tranquillimonas alkanivorans]SFP06775.1 hypothetical protein SAMN04488047_102187 [Tranquillimonas alkanivorans]
MVEDYTNAFLVWACILLFCGLFAIWVKFGLFAALATGFVADRCIGRPATDRR